MTPLEFLEKTSEGLNQISRDGGAIICPKHHLDHTGKTAYAVILDLELYDKTQNKKYLERARNRARYVFSQIKPESDGKTWIVWPGRHGRKNMSNSAIDSGAGIDALSSFLSHTENGFGKNERRNFENAVEKVCATYLLRAAQNKEITNQRLWASTGLAAAYRIFPKPEWKETVLRSIENSLKEQWPEGFFPYHPRPQEFGLPQEAKDITPFYHSRHLGFIFYALEKIGEDWQRFREPLEKGINALVSLIGRDGFKFISLETKRWYWHSDYEVASYAFDLYALLKWFEKTREENVLPYAKILWENLKKYQQEDGFLVSSLENKENFQCNVFWTCHLAWLARVFKNIPEEAPGFGEEKTYFKNADLFRIGTADWLFESSGRTSFPEPRGWGRGAGGGNILYFGRKENNFSNLQKIKHKHIEGGDAAGSWMAQRKTLSWKNFKDGLKFLRQNLISFKEQGYYMRVELEAKNFSAALHIFFSHFLRILKTAFLGRISSQWGGQAETLFKENGIIYEVAPRDSQSKTADEFYLTREYSWQNNGEIEVRDEIKVEKPLQIICWKKFGSGEKIIKSDFNFKIKSKEIIFKPRGKTGLIEIHYNLCDYFM